MGRTTWLTPFGEEWEKKKGTPPNYKRLAMELGIVKKCLKKQGLSDERAIARMRAHWREYLYQTPTKWLSPTRFRETFNGHNPQKNHAHRTDKELDKGLRHKERRLLHRSPEREPSQPQPLQVDFPI